MTDRVRGTGESSTLGREEALWAEIIRCEIDSWRPRRLSPRFQPGPQRQQAPLRGGLPLVVAACLIALTVATLANLTSDVGGVLHQIGVIRPLSVPGSTSAGPPPFRRGHEPAVGSGSFASSARTGTAPRTPSPHITRAGTASEPRTTAPSPSAQAPAPLPSPPPPPSTSPSPLVIPPFATPASGDAPGGLSAGHPPGAGGVPLPSPG